MPIIATGQYGSPVRQPSPEVVGQHIHSVPAGSPPGGKVASVAYPPGGPSPGWDATPCGTSPGPRVRAARGSGTLRWVDRGSAVWYGRRVKERRLACRVSV